MERWFEKGEAPKRMSGKDHRRCWKIVFIQMCPKEPEADFRKGRDPSRRRIPKWEVAEEDSQGHSLLPLPSAMAPVTPRAEEEHRDDTDDTERDVVKRHGRARGVERARAAASSVPVATALSVSSSLGTSSKLKGIEMVNNREKGMPEPPDPYKTQMRAYYKSVRAKPKGKKANRDTERNPEYWECY
jgi:hypothetical protein